MVDETRSEQLRLNARLALGPPTSLYAQDLPENPEAELVWNTARTFSIGGRALYPSVDFALRRGSLLIDHDGEVSTHPSPPDSAVGVHECDQACEAP